jgi:hypothetical protein
MFALAFIGASYPIPSSSFQQVDPTHWTLDVCAVQPNYSALKEACLLLGSPTALPSPGTPNGPPAPLALGLYIRCGDNPNCDPWLYRGCVHAARPSEVVSLQWPTRPGSVGEAFASGPGVALLGVSIEPLADLEAKETARLGEQLQLGRAVALDLSAYLGSFAKTVNGGEAIVVPPGALDTWLERWESKYKRDPDFVLRKARELIPLPIAALPAPRGSSGGGGGGGF